MGFVGKKMALNKLLISEYLCVEDVSPLKSYTLLTGT